MNVVNFVRGCEPRIEVDLVEPIKKQLELLEKNGLKSTFLLQYDALLRKDMTDLFVGCDGEKTEIGGWFELVRRQVEACGLKWRGRDGYDWDYFAEVDTPMGYSKDERIALVDEFMAKFKTTFGYYPKSMGAWAIDAFTLGYIYDKYNIDAFCICREQVGTDGYNFSGGYYSGGYYASKNNLLCPAQTEENQINAPIFRMLGSDVVKQYYSGLDKNFNPAALQGVVTLEPVGDGKIGGSNPAWVDWFLKVNYGEALNFAYAQAGQENSFGWNAMRAGLTDQFAKFAALQKEGKLVVEPLGDTGRWYKETYGTTPASAITAHGAWDDPALDSVWFSDKFYRANLYGDKKSVRVRDLHIFDEGMPDPFEETVCTANEAVYETLPAVDGNRYSGNGVVAGLYPVDETTGEPFAYDKMEFTDLGEGKARVNFGSIVFGMRDNLLLCTADRPFRLENRIGKDGGHLPTVVSLTEKELTLSYSGRTYRITLEKGTFRDAKTLLSENNIVSARFTAK